MAINNGRYIVTGGYMDPNGNIIEERQYIPQEPLDADYIMGQVKSLLSGEKTPEQIRQEDGIQGYNSNYFPRSEAFGLQAQGYANQGDTAMANVYGDIANSLGKYSTFANTSVNTADALLNYLRQNEAGLQGVAGNLYNQLTGDIQTQRDYIMDTFGPEGTLTKEVNQYYDDLGNYLASDAGRQAATIAAQGVHSGASLGAIRAQQNEAYNQSFQRYVQAKEQEINAKQSIAANLINYMSTLRREYGDTTNQYIIELYKRANDMYNNVAQSIASDLDQYNALRYSGTGSSSNTYDAILKMLSGQNPTDNSGNGSTGGTSGGTSSQGNTTITEPANKGASSGNGVNWGQLYLATNPPLNLAWQGLKLGLNALDKTLNK